MIVPRFNFFLLVLLLLTILVCINSEEPVKPSIQKDVASAVPDVQKAAAAGNNAENVKKQNTDKTTPPKMDAREVPAGKKDDAVQKPDSPVPAEALNVEKEAKDRSPEGNEPNVQAQIPVENKDEKNKVPDHELQRKQFEMEQRQVELDRQQHQLYLQQQEMERRRQAEMYHRQNEHYGAGGLAHENEDIPLDKFDFDPSEGLSFVVQGGQKECFYEDVVLENDHISGAYIVSAADSLIDFTIVGPSRTTLFDRYSEKEGEYDITVAEKGQYELCFSNYRSSEAKLITHVTHKLESSHPVHKEHVSNLARIAEQMDVKLGELESEQRLLQVRTDRHIKTEESTNKRVAWYGTAECVAYIAISILQVAYIKYLLDAPRPSRSWA